MTLTPMKRRMALYRVAPMLPLELEQHKEPLMEMLMRWPLMRPFRP